MGEIHYQILCKCGIVLSQCRCPGPKATKVSTEVCKHEVKKKSKKKT